MRMRETNKTCLVRKAIKNQLVMEEANQPETTVQKYMNLGLKLIRTNEDTHSYIEINYP